MTEHIKMPDVAPIVRYVATGSQTIFSYPFPVFASEDLKVYLNGAEQISGFTISGAGATAGGDVTFDTAPTNAVIVTLERELPIERVTDFLEGGDFSAQAINNELDYLIAALQQVREQVHLRLEGPAKTVEEVLDRHLRPPGNTVPQEVFHLGEAFHFIAVSMLPSRMFAPAASARFLTEGDYTQ